MREVLDQSLKLLWITKKNVQTRAVQLVQNNSVRVSMDEGAVDNVLEVFLIFVRSTRLNKFLQI